MSYYNINNNVYIISIKVALVVVVEVEVVRSINIKVCNYCHRKQLYKVYYYYISYFNLP